MAASDAAGLAVARAADRSAAAFDAEVKVKRLAPADARPRSRAATSTRCSPPAGCPPRRSPTTRSPGSSRPPAREVRQAAALRQAGLDAAAVQRALNPPPLKVTTVEPADPERDRKGGFAFIAVLALYAQLLTFGYLLASGVVEEKASRVVEVLLSTIQARDLLAGKIIGLGLLGFAQVVAIAGVGVGAAAASGALEVDGDIVVAAALAVGWFVLGYAFYAGLFACAGALVPRQEELQSSMTPLTMVILISFFISFAVLDDPDGTLAHVTSFIPFSAPMTMPPRIALGEASAFEIVAAFAVTAAARSRWSRSPGGSTAAPSCAPVRRSSSARPGAPRGPAPRRGAARRRGTAPARAPAAPARARHRGRDSGSAGAARPAPHRPARAAGLASAGAASTGSASAASASASTGSAAASSSSTCMSCARTAVAIASRMSAPFLIDVVAPVSCCLTRSTSPIAPVARSIASRIADGSIPSASPRAISTRARASA